MAMPEVVPDPVPDDAAGITPLIESPSARRSRLVLAGFLTLMGVLHFAFPAPFDRLIPRWLPGRPRTWTYTSGVAELGSAALLAHPRTRRIGAWAAMGTIAAVYPANVQMALDNPPTTLLGVGAWARLPLQFPMLWWAQRHSR